MGESTLHIASRGLTIDGSIYTIYDDAFITNASDSKQYIIIARLVYRV